MDSYTYSRLQQNEIRLIRIEGPDDLTCSITVASVLSPPDYIALSYTWDDQAPSHQLLCDGSPLYVTQNVMNFLKFWRWQDGGLLWIDAVCINQKDVLEKNAQVRQMREVYKNAKEVVISLGESTPIIDGALAELPSVNEKFNSISPARYIPFDLDSLTSVGLPASDCNFWKGMSVMFDYSWFRRLWVVQEAVFARKATFRIGETCVDLDLLEVFVRNLKSFGLERPLVSLSGGQDYQSKGIVHGIHALGFIKRTRTRIAADLPSDTSLNWIVRGCSRMCSNPLDKVYALLGFCDDELQEAVPINYESTLMEMYEAFARAWVATHGGFEILHLMYFDGSRDLPSWIPDFAPANPNWTLGGLLPTTGKKYNASGSQNNDPQHVLTLVPDSRCIRVSGFPLDEVVHVVPGTWSWLQQLDLTESITLATESLQWEESCVELARKVYQVPGTDSTVPEDYARTLIADMTWAGGQPARRTTPCLPAYKSFKRHTQSFITPPYMTSGLVKFEEGMSQDEIDAHADFAMRLMAACYQRRFFATRDGRIGLGPLSVRPSDLVCVFHDADTPFILRSSPDEGFYTFVGESYVHGLMDGEAIVVKDASHIVDQNFLIG
ncbi:hypothetical protein MMC30_001974 [Trapelia coarctata]|nr:hypothetical protein [Trapelia coarctata]